MANYELDSVYLLRDWSPSENSLVSAFYFKPDGSEVFVCDDSNMTIYQYSLSVAWDTSSASYSGNSFDFGTAYDNEFGFSYPGFNGIHLSEDGTKMFFCDVDQYVDECSLSVAWDVSSASYAGVYEDLGAISSINNNCEGFFWKSDGLTFWAIDSNLNCHEFSVGSAWSFSGLSLVQSVSGFTVGSGLEGFCMSRNGNYMYFCDSGEVVVEQYDVSSSYDISTASFSFSYDVNSDGITSPGDAQLGNSGQVFFVSDDNDDVISSFGFLNLPDFQEFNKRVVKIFEGDKQEVLDACSGAGLVPIYLIQNSSNKGWYLLASNIHQKV